MSKFTRCYVQNNLSVGIYIKLVIFAAIINAITLSNRSALAQITPDNTLPNNSQVTKINNIINIEGGSRTGNNLFHSFNNFTVPTGSEVDFQNSLDVQNIIGLVTDAVRLKLRMLVGTICGLGLSAYLKTVCIGGFCWHQTKISNPSRAERQWERYSDCDFMAKSVLVVSQCVGRLCQQSCN